MDIQYLSSSDQAQFAELLRDDAELIHIFGQLMVQLEVDSDYDSVMLSFTADNRLRVAIDDSPYIVVLDEDEQDITLLSRSEFDDEGSEEFLEQSDFDDDGVEIIVDIMASRILSDENHVE